MRPKCKNTEQVKRNKISRTNDASLRTCSQIEFQNSDMKTQAELPNLI